MKARLQTADPKGLIEEAYKINGITEGECRSIFFGWVFGIEGKGVDELRQLVITLYEHYLTDYPNHPMTRVLAEGLVRRNLRPQRKRSSWRKGHPS